MGRPINKRYFGGGPGNQIAIVGRIVGQSEGTGQIVAQKGTRKFLVDINGVQGIVRISATDAFTKGGLNEGEAVIEGVLDTSLGGGTVNITKIWGNECVVSNDGSIRPSGATPGAKMGWNFVSDLGDGYLQLGDAPSIDITSQPIDAISAGGTVAYAVVVTAVAGLAYAWELNPVSGAQGPGDWVSATGTIEGLTYSNETTATLGVAGVVDVSDDGNLYRCVVSATDLSDVNSDEVTLTYGS